MMPVMDGYGFLDEQQQDPELALIPVAIVTAGHNVDWSRLGSGRTVLNKPIELPQLLAILQGFVA
jgi:CheY-like chemotaxis protein